VALERPSAGDQARLVAGAADGAAEVAAEEAEHGWFASGVEGGHHGVGCCGVGVDAHPVVGE
jgi:hypothetical protein